MPRSTRLAVPLLLAALALALSPATRPAAAQDDAPSLYERMGGYDVIAATVDDFLARLNADARLQPLFVGVSATSGPRIRQHIVDFVCAETGGPCAYHGRSMADAHAGMPIADEHFDAAVDHMGDALESQGVGERERRELVSWLRSLRSAFVAQS